MKSKSIAIVQSSYIPWKGYFDLIHGVDEFILFDDVQYTRRDWRNRNRIKTSDGPKWLSIPVNTKGRFMAPIREITIADAGWGARHWRTLTAAYGRAPHFGNYAELFEALYLRSSEDRLSAVNRAFIEAICGILGIRTRLSWSMEYEIVDGRTERIVSLCRQALATRYVSGPTARAYLDARQFERAGVELQFMDYSGYSEYVQAYPPFDHHVTMLDLLFSEGPRAPRFMLSF